MEATLAEPFGIRHTVLQVEPARGVNAGCLPV